VIFSPPTQHALRALIFLANHEGARPVQAREIAAAENIPSAFLSKILNRLRARGFLRSIMGPGGGYVLARPAQNLRVRDIVEAFDDAHSLDSRCLLGIGLCGEHGTCPLHDQWEEVRESFSLSIAALSLREIASSLEPPSQQHSLSKSRGPKKSNRRARAGSRAPAKKVQSRRRKSERGKQ